MKKKKMISLLTLAFFFMTTPTLALANDGNQLTYNDQEVYKGILISTKVYSDGGNGEMTSYDVIDRGNVTDEEYITILQEYIANKENNLRLQKVISTPVPQKNTRGLTKYYSLNGVSQQNSDVRVQAQGNWMRGSDGGPYIGVSSSRKIEGCWYFLVDSNKKMKITEKFDISSTGLSATITLPAGIGGTLSHSDKSVSVDWSDFALGETIVRAYPGVELMASGGPWTYVINATYSVTNQATLVNTSWSAHASESWVV